MRHIWNETTDPSNRSNMFQTFKSHPKIPMMRFGVLGPGGPEPPMAVACSSKTLKAGMWHLERQLMSTTDVLEIFRDIWDIVAVFCVKSDSMRKYIFACTYDISLTSWLFTPTCNSARDVPLSLGQTMRRIWHLLRGSLAASPPATGGYIDFSMFSCIVLTFTLQHRGPIAL